MTQIELENYGTTNASLKLKDAYGDTELAFDLYFPPTPYLPTGTYLTDPEAKLNIGEDASYSYANINGTKKTYKSAELIVSSEGEIYTMLVNATLSDDSQINAKYIGKLPKFSPYLSGEFKGLLVDGDEMHGQAPQKSKIAKKPRLSVKK